MTVKKLIEVITYCSKAINSKSVVPVLCDYMLFDKGRVIASDLHLTAWASLGEPCSTFLVPYKELLSILKKLPGTNELKILYDDKTYTLKIDSGAYSFTLATENPGDFPKLPEPDCYAGMLHQSDIQAAVYATDFVSDDELRPAMTGVYLNSNIVGTDGVRLMQRKLEGTIYPACIIPKKALRLLNGFEFAEAYTDSHTQPVNIEFTNNERGVVSRVINENFPKWRKVWPTAKVNKIDCEVNRTDLIKAINMAGALANKCTHQIILRILADGLQLHSIDMDTMAEFKSDTLPFVKVSKAKFEFDRIGFNYRLLLPILKQSKKPTVRLRFAGANKACVIDANYLIMPVMLMEYA